MPDNEHNDREAGLEEELRELGRSIEYPPAPDISRAVRSRIEGEERSSGGLWPRLPSAKWAAAAAVVVVMASPFFSPAFRDAVSNLLVSGPMSGGAGGAGGVVSESAESRDGPPDSARPMGEAGESAPSDGAGLPDSASSAGVAEDAADLPESAVGGGVEEDVPTPGGVSWERISPEEARQRAGADIPFLPPLGEPASIRTSGPDGFALVYGTDPTVALTARPGEVEAVFPAATRPDTEDATVDGERGYWRSSGVLFWERGGVALRLQSDLPKDEAVRLAESIQ